MEAVPWAVGGGAEHSPEVARTATYALSSGAEGIVEPADLRVLPLSVPGAAVRVMPGAALVRARSTSGAGQTYTARNGVAEQVDVSATGSSGGRSDLVILRIEDPFMSGEPWQEPEDPKVGPYAFIRIVPNVPAGTTRIQDVSGHSRDSAITLARIDIPASTATITAGMIKDLREVAIPRRYEAVFARPRVGGDDGPHMYLNASLPKGEAFPGGGGTVPNAVWIDVPSWATSMTVSADWMSISYGAGANANGYYWMEYGTEARSDHSWPSGGLYEFRTQQFGFNSPASGDPSRDNWRLMDRRSVPAKLRGAPCRFVFMAGRRPEATGDVYMNSLGGLGLRVLFEQVAELP